MNRVTQRTANRLFEGTATIQIIGNGLVEDRYLFDLFINGEIVSSDLPTYTAALELAIEIVNEEA